MRLPAAYLSYTLLLSASTVALAQGEMSCEFVIANAERSKADMQIASETYFQGYSWASPASTSTM